MPFYKHCSDFRDLVNYPVPCKRSGYLEQFWTALVWTLGNGSNQIPKWTDPKFIRSRVNGALVCEIPRSFERSSPSNFRTQGSFIHINSGKIFERDLLSSDSVAKSATQKPWVFWEYCSINSSLLLFLYWQECDQAHIDDVAADDNGQDLSWVYFLNMGYVINLSTLLSFLVKSIERTPQEIQIKL